MDSNTHKGDLISNPSARCACILVLDTSSSMYGEPIDELNEGVSQFIDEVRNDEMAAISVELGIVTTGGSAQEEMPIAAMLQVLGIVTAGGLAQEAQEEMPITPMLQVDSAPSFGAGGLTPLGGAVEIALNMLDSRKQEYKNAGVPYYQPWLVIISDGAPTDDWESPAARAKGLGQNGKLVVLPVGVSGADMGILSEFSDKTAVPLAGVQFKQFFAWLSASMANVSRSTSTTASVQLPPMTWSSI